MPILSPKEHPLVAKFVSKATSSLTFHHNGGWLTTWVWPGCVIASHNVVLCTVWSGLEWRASQICSIIQRADHAGESFQWYLCLKGRTKLCSVYTAGSLHFHWWNGRSSSSRAWAWHGRESIDSILPVGWLQSWNKRLSSFPFPNLDRHVPHYMSETCKWMNQTMSLALVSLLVC